MSTEKPARRYRYSSAITLAAIIAMISGLSLLTWAPYLTPVLVVPLGVAIWNWRAGTDVDPNAITVRAALGSRRLPWASVTGLVPDARGRISAQLSSGAQVGLTAVRASDPPDLLAAAGQELLGHPPTESELVQ